MATVLSLCFALLCFALLCLGLGAGAVLPSRAGALPHPSFGMDGLGLYEKSAYLWFPEVRVGSLLAGTGTTAETTCKVSVRKRGKHA